MPRTLVLLVFASALLLHAPTAIPAQEGTTTRLDRFGDPLPVGALTRLGTLRFHRCGCAAYSPDGKLLAAPEGEEVILWDIATSKKIRQLAVKNDRFTVGLIFSHDGKKLAVIGWGGTSITVWDLNTFKNILLTQADGGSAGGDWSNAVAFSSDDKTLFAATSTMLFVWDLASGEKRKEFPLPLRARMIAFSEDGKVAATQGDEKVHLWDPQTGKLLNEIKLLRGGETMKFSPDGKTLVVAGFRHWMNLFSVESVKKMHSLPVSDQVVSVSFSPDGKTLAAACNATIHSSSTEGDQVIRLWDLTKPQAPPVKFPALGIHSVRLSPDGKTLAWGCYGSTLCFMDRVTGKDLQPTASHRGTIKALVYLPDGKRIVSASEDGMIRIWDAEKGESLKVLHGHVCGINGLALFPNGKLLASCGQDGTFRLWDIELGKSLAVLKDEGNSVVAAAFSADGKQLASGGNRGVIFLRDPATGKVLDQVEADSISSLAFSPDGKTLAVLLEHENKLLLLDRITNKVKVIPIARGGSCVAYSPDGKFLAVSSDETMVLLDPATNGLLKRLPGHFNQRSSIVFSPDSRYLASVSDGFSDKANRTIRVFELATGTEIHTFKKELPIYAAAFSPDGSKLAVGGEDATAVILDLRNLTGKKRRDQLTERELEGHWESLAAADASKAYDARVDLLHAPKSALPFLAKHLQPTPAVDGKRVEGLINKLDSESFPERDEANKELEQLGELVREPMRKALAAEPPPEKRQRLQALLGKLDGLSPSQLRLVRAIEVLEGIGTPEAIRIIERLRQGNPESFAYVESGKVIARRQKQSAPLPQSPIAQDNAAPANQAVPPSGPVRHDRDGDPMPPGAIARLGSGRWRLASEPRRIVVSADGKTLAVVNSVSGVEILDSNTGRSIDRSRSGTFGWGGDLRMAIALSSDWRKVAAMEDGEQPKVILAVFDRDKAEKVKIEFARAKESYPVIPEEVEEGRFYSSTREYISALEFSSDAKMLVGSVRFELDCGGCDIVKKSKESHLVAWNASTGKEIWKSLASEQRINTILFAPDGKTLTVVDEASVSFWDAATGRELRRWQSKDPLFSARYSPDRNWIATGSKEAVLLWEVATGKLRRRLQVPGNEVKAMAFSPDGKLLVGGGDKTIRFWDPLTGKTLGDCSAIANPVQAVAFSSDGKTLFSGHENENLLRRWDVDGRKPVGEFNSPIIPVSMLAFSGDSRKILATSMGKDLYLWESETGKPCLLPPKDDQRFMTEWLASSGQTSLLRCEEIIGSVFANFQSVKIDRRDRIPGFLGSSVDGQHVLVQSEKDTLPCLTVLKVRRDKPKNDIEREFVWKASDHVSAVLSPDGKTVAAAGKDVVCFFDVSTGQERRYQQQPNVKSDLFFFIRSLKFSADGSRIALVSSEGKVRILAVKDGRRITEFATHSRHLFGLAFSPDGQTLLTMASTGRVNVWEVATGEVVRRLELAIYLYSPDNRMLAGSAKTLKVTDLYSGRILRECQAEVTRVGDVAFSPNSKLVAASCSDTTILVWPASTADAKLDKALDEKNLAQVLENGSAADAYPAIGRMIADPERTLPFLEQRLHAVAKIDAERVQSLIADLDSDQPNRQEVALKELAQLGPLVAPNLRVALSSDKVHLESKKRIEKLLQDLDGKEPTLSAEEILHVRAIQALERIATKRARQLLEKLAQGADISPRTRAAVEALKRMEAQ